MFRKYCFKDCFFCFNDCFIVSLFQKQSERTKTAKNQIFTHKTITDMSYNQNQIEGLKKRMGAGFSKFGREGSVIKWMFTWADSGKLQTGYNQGIIKNSETNNELLAILKNKIFEGFLTRKTIKGIAYPEAISNKFEVYILGDTKEADILFFTLKFFWIEEKGKKIKDVSLDISESISSFFNHGELRYIEEMFVAFKLKITNRTATSALSKLNELKEQLRAKAPAAAQYEKYDVRRFTVDQQQQAIKYCTDITEKNPKERPSCIQYYSELCDIHNWVKPTVWQ